jgi:uncharacterized protein (TIGR00369 family)
MGTSERTRTVTWEDPTAGAARGASLSGLEHIRAIMAGTLPPAPIAQLMGFDVVEASEGRCVFTVEPAEYHYNPIGVVHGGLAATLLDSCMGCAIHTALPRGKGYTTLEIKVNYVKALRRDTGPVRATGTVIHVGNRVATAEGKIQDASGKLYAHGTTTCLVFAE